MTQTRLAAKQYFTCVFISHVYENQYMRGRPWRCFRGSFCCRCCLEREIFSSCWCLQRSEVYTHVTWCPLPPALRKMGKGMPPSASIKIHPGLLGNEYQLMFFPHLLICMQWTSRRMGGKEESIWFVSGATLLSVSPHGSSASVGDKGNGGWRTVWPLTNSSVLENTEWI